MSCLSISEISRGQAVGDRCLWRDVGVVAPLRGVAHGNQERLFGQELAVGRDGVGLRTVFHVFRHARADV